MRNLKKALPPEDFTVAATPEQLDRLVQRSKRSPVSCYEHHLSVVSADNVSRAQGEVQKAVAELSAAEKLHRCVLRIVIPDEEREGSLQDNLQDAIAEASKRLDDERKAREAWEARRAEERRLLETVDWIKRESRRAVLARAEADLKAALRSIHVS